MNLSVCLQNIKIHVKCLLPLEIVWVLVSKSLKSLTFLTKETVRNLTLHDFCHSLTHLDSKYQPKIIFQSINVYLNTLYATLND